MTTDPGGSPKPAATPAPASPLPRPYEPSAKEWKVTPATFGAGTVAFVAWMAWSSGGSRVGLFVCVATLAALAVDLGWSQIATARVKATVTQNPAEVLVGDPVGVTMRLDGPSQHVTVALYAVTMRATPVDVPAAAAHFDGRVDSRQVATEVIVEVAGSGVAGLVGCLRRQHVKLVQPLAVGPRPIAAAEPMPDLAHSWGDGEPKPASAGDIVRGVRPYVPGDALRRVHWRTSARVGELMVKEVEDTDSPRLVIALDLGTGGPAAEAAAGRASWYADEAIRRGYRVVLATVERAGTALQRVTAPVGSPSDVIRRLAAAAFPGRPELPAPQAGEGVLLVTPQGDSWR